MPTRIWVRCRHEYEFKYEDFFKSQCENRYCSTLPKPSPLSSQVPNKIHLGKVLFFYIFTSFWKNLILLYIYICQNASAVQFSSRKTFNCIGHGTEIFFIYKFNRAEHWIPINDINFWRSHNYYDTEFSMHNITDFSIVEQILEKIEAL